MYALEFAIATYFCLMGVMFKETLKRELGIADHSTNTTSSDFYMPPFPPLPTLKFSPQIYYNLTGKMMEYDVSVLCGKDEACFERVFPPQLPTIPTPKISHNVPLSTAIAVVLPFLLLCALLGYLAKEKVDLLDEVSALKSAKQDLVRQLEQAHKEISEQAKKLNSLPKTETTPEDRTPELPPTSKAAPPSTPIPGPPYKFSLEKGGAPVPSDLLAQAFNPSTKHSGSPLATMDVNAWLEAAAEKDAADAADKEESEKPAQAPAPRPRRKQLTERERMQKQFRASLNAPRRPLVKPDPGKVVGEG